MFLVSDTRKKFYLPCGTEWNVLYQYVVITVQYMITLVSKAKTGEMCEI
jgi:hypothetical protein